MNNNSKSGKSHSGVDIIGGFSKYNLNRSMGKRERRRMLARLERLIKKKERGAGRELGGL